MQDPTTSLTPRELLDLFRSRRSTLFWWALLGGAIAAIGVLVVPRNWSAHQGLLIRSDAAGYSNQRLGKFTDLSEMKTVQETLLELAKSHRVVTAVLKEVGPSTQTTVWGTLTSPLRWIAGRGAGWPSDQDIVDFRDQLLFAPPGGAEFGKTEVFYLGALDPDRQRVAALVSAMTSQLERRLQELRDARAEGLVQEVRLGVSVARQELAKSVERLAAFETRVGADLSELRNMTSPIGGQSEFAQRALALEAELRVTKERSRGLGMLLTELQQAGEDPSKIVSTSDALLIGQPGLRRLKAGLIEAQLSVARIGGARTSDHPFVRAARVVQEKTLQELANELPTAITSVEFDLDIANKRQADLTEQLESLRNRSAELAGMRTEYAELTASVESRTQLLRSALAQLADAESHRAAAASTSLLTRIDAVESSAKPIGPSRKVVVAAGALAGLILGSTIVLLFSPSPSQALRQRLNSPSSPSAGVESNGPWAVEKHPVYQNGI